MNFGNWIVVSFVLFAAFIGTLVVVCLREDISLVSKDYYQEELVYEDQIQRLNNVAALKEKPVISVVDHMVQVEFSQFNTIEHAELEIFCPSNASMDRKFLVKSSDQPVQFFQELELRNFVLHATISGDRVVVCKGNDIQPFGFGALEQLNRCNRRLLEITRCRGM